MALIKDFRNYDFYKVEGGGEAVHGVNAFYGNRLDKSEPPTARQIMDQLTHSKDYFAQFHHNCRLVDQYYEGANPIFGNPRQYPFVINPMDARSTIENATNHVNVEHMDIDVPAASPRGQIYAEKRQKFLKGLWFNTDPAITRHGARDPMAYGIGWYKLQWDMDVWPDSPHRKDSPASGSSAAPWWKSWPNGTSPSRSTSPTSSRRI